MTRSVSTSRSSSTSPPPPPNPALPNATEQVIREVQEGKGVSISLAIRRKGLSLRDGNLIDPATGWRWMRKGLTRPDGTKIRLEAVRIGRSWLTTEAALDRFLAALQTGSDPVPTSPAAPIEKTDTRTAKANARRLAELAEVEAELDRMGV